MPPRDIHTNIMFYEVTGSFINALPSLGSGKLHNFNIQDHIPSYWKT